MDDLISRQAILKHIEKIRQGALMMDDIRRASIIMNGMYLCEEAAINQPSADAVKVVRCKDCYHYDEENEYCIFNDREMKLLDFCSYGSI